MIYLAQMVIFHVEVTKGSGTAAWSCEHHTGGLHGMVRPPLGMLVAAGAVRLGAADHELKEAPGGERPGTIKTMAVEASTAWISLGNLIMKYIWIL